MSITWPWLTDSYSAPSMSSAIVCSKSSKILAESLNKLFKSLLISGLVLFLIHVLLFSMNSSFYISIFAKLRHEHPASATPTDLSHIVFGIAGTVNSWYIRKHYAESWWKPNKTRGFIFFETTPAEFPPWPHSSPPFRISEDTSRYKDYDKHGSREAIRMTRIIAETFAEVNDDGVRWYVLADDDTVFFADNLVDVLAKYDHRNYLYIGMRSESYPANYFHSFEMAFGGAGYALSYPLAKALVKNMDVCIKRYPDLYGSDHIMQSCVADLGVSLTQERGFHQIDFHGDIWGFLSCHPQSPLVTLHHFDQVDPIFPSMNRVQALRHLMKPANADQPRLLQHVICYHKPRNWTFSISWGYSVQIYDAVILPSILRRPVQSFTPWSSFFKPHFVFNPRYPFGNPCEAPHMFFFDSVGDGGVGYRVTSYTRRKARSLPPCSSAGNHSADFMNRIVVLSPATKYYPVGRRECCDVLHITRRGVAEVKIRDCFENEILP